MSNNLSVTQLTSNQNNKETTINDKDGELDAAITETLTKTVTSTNAATITQAELQRAAFIQVDPDGVDPPTAAITLTVDTAFKRGVFSVFNNTAQEVTITITGQSATAPVLLAGAMKMLALEGANVREGTPSTSVATAGFGDGSAASPSIFFTADDDTGFYRKGVDSIGVASNGSEVASFDPAQITLPSGVDIVLNGFPVLTTEDNSGDVSQSSNIVYANTGLYGGDLNDLVGVGERAEWTNMTNFITNEPPGAIRTGSSVFTRTWDTLGNIARQLFLEHDSNNVWTRALDGTWSAWTLLLDSDDLAANGGTVPETNNTNTFSVDQTFSGDVLLADGAAATPSLTFTLDPDSGFYSQAANAIGVASGGAEVARFDAGGVLAPAGSVSRPGYAFLGNENTGLYNISPLFISLVSGGAERVRFGNAMAYVSLGGEAFASMSWVGDASTGMFSPTSGRVAMTCFGTEQVRWDTIRATHAGAVQYPSFTVGTVPAGATGDNIFVTDEVGGAQPAYYDGTNWRRYSDGAVIST